MPGPFTQKNADSPPQVYAKLADYGISRPTLPTGAKGFGGTEGFMAPEIVKYNGEEEYTEKVDCFSFGMFIYELVRFFTAGSTLNLLLHPSTTYPVAFQDSDHVNTHIIVQMFHLFLDQFNSC